MCGTYSPSCETPKHAEQQYVCECMCGLKSYVHICESFMSCHCSCSDHQYLYCAVNMYLRQFWPLYSNLCFIFCI